MTSLLQKYGVGFAAVFGLLAFLVGITSPHGEGALVAGGIWFGAALISAQIVRLRSDS